MNALRSVPSAKLQRILADFRFLDVPEVVSLTPQFVLVSQRVAHHAASFGPGGSKRENMFASREGDFTDCDLAALEQCLPYNSKSPLIGHRFPAPQNRASLQIRGSTLSDR